ncbi:MAG TPA: DUF433 domain-containing protein [Acidimicrobiia bacterium]|nr:DUF433 domain-containing protein [Acidimicrobiia bacterium]
MAESVTPPRYVREVMIANEKTAALDHPLIGRGIYDVVDVARLVGRDPETISRWTGGREALHQVRAKPLFTFLDMISLWVISELITRGVSKYELRAGRDYLATKLETQFPFAHKRLATVGGAFFGELAAEWIDVGKSGQRAFQTVIEDYVRPIEFGADDLAAIWRPRGGVWINPSVQAGSPCIDGTRVPTALLAALVAEDEDPQNLAADFDLDVGQVEAALKFERAA